MVFESLNFGNVLGQLEGMGFYEYLLPFLLVFTIIFAILEKTKLMGTEGQNPKTNINALLAVIIALIVIVQTDITMVMNMYLSKMALFIVIVLIFLLVLGVFGANVEHGLKGGFLGFGFIISIIAVLWALSPEIGLGEFFDRYYIFTDADRAILLFIGIFFLVLWFITKKSDTHHGTDRDNWLTKLGKSLGGDNH